MNKIPAILINYCSDPTWLKDYPQLDVTLYDRSDDGVPRDLTVYGKVIRSPNLGDVDFDKLTWLVENYDNLPEVFVWGKSNLFKFVDQESFNKSVQKSLFAPLLKLDHKTYYDQYGEVCKYVGTEHGAMYAERADSWYFNAGLDNKGNFRSWHEWAYAFRLPVEAFVPFPPGGNYILTRERVLRHSRDLYDEMRSTLNYAAHPVEAHCCERSYFYLWR